jgi:hypothetical protein
MKILFNFAHNKFYAAQAKNAETGLSIGGFDTAHQYRMSDIGPEFMAKNAHILNLSRGAGYWMWKYYFFDRLLTDDSIPEGSYIFYSDSGSHFVDSVDHLIEVLERDQQSIQVYRQNHASYIWTKRDMFILMDADREPFLTSCQRVGGWMLAKKDDFSRKFFAECLHYSQDFRIITDAGNQLGQPNYPGFRDHRHDESLITIMAKKYELFPYRNPSQHGMIDDVNWTHNRYGLQGLLEMTERYGQISSWLDKYGLYFHGETLNQYPTIDIDDRSTYPVILTLTRDGN